MGVRCFVPVLSREFGKLTSGELKASSATPDPDPTPFLPAANHAHHMFPISFS